MKNQPKVERSEASYTPGPWTTKKAIRGDSYIVFGPTTMTGTEVITGHISEANARLIGDAPETAAERDRLKTLNAELLEALREISRAGHDGHLVGLIGEGALELVDNAIAKGEGTLK